jgi:hypothetical protein
VVNGIALGMLIPPQINYNLVKTPYGKKYFLGAVVFIIVTIFGENGQKMFSSIFQDELILATINMICLSFLVG